MKNRRLQNNFCRESELVLSRQLFLTEEICEKNPPPEITVHGKCFAENRDFAGQILCQQLHLRRRPAGFFQLAEVFFLNRAAQL